MSAPGRPAKEKEEAELSSHISMNDLSEDTIDQQESSLFLPSSSSSSNAPGESILRVPRLRRVVLLAFLVISGSILLVALFSGPYAGRAVSAFRLDHNEASLSLTASQSSAPACSPCSGDALQFCQTWSEKVIRRGVSYAGTGTHTARLLQKIESGSKVKLGFLGGEHVGQCALEFLDAEAPLLQAQ